MKHAWTLLHSWFLGEPDDYGRWWWCVSALAGFFVLYAFLLTFTIAHDIHDYHVRIDPFARRSYE